MVEPESIWRTPAEKADYATTPDYAATLGFLESLAASHREKIRLEDFGRSGEGRELKIVIASQDGVFDPDAIHASGRAILLVQNAIHAGEMDGKDACLALLRDLVCDADRSSLLEHAVLVFIPVYNVDGHERRGVHNRINQNGPSPIGWRANGSNLNLNRDYMKADAPETRAFLRMFRRWLPDFFVDNHVTDGADFEYDVTFLLDTGPDVFPATGDWLREVVSPELVSRLESAGHLAFPSQIFLNDDTDPSKGLARNDNPPRFSTGRMILENRPGLLVELHMLKDYRTRVRADYELMVSLLHVLARDSAKLIALNRAADRDAAQLGTTRAHASTFPLALSGNGETTPVDFRGVEFTRTPSDISGAFSIRYGSKPWRVRLPLETGVQVQLSVRPPAGYIVPPQWTRVVEVLDAHGLTMLRTAAEWTGRVGRYRCSGMRWPERPFEGRHPILRGGNVEREFGHFGACLLTSETLTYPAGSVVVPLTQRLSKVAIHFLEPEAPDSALRWGFFDPIFEQKEQGEAYVVEKLAREMLARDPAVRAEFEQRLQADPAFAGSPSERLGFFFDRSPWATAQRIGEYPVGRLETLDGLPVV